MQRISSDRFPLTRLLIPYIPRPGTRTLLIIGIPIAVLLVVSQLWILLLPMSLPLLLLVCIHYAPNVVFDVIQPRQWRQHVAVGGTHGKRKK